MEMIDGTTWSNLVPKIDVEHNQLGYHCNFFEQKKDHENEKTFGLLAHMYKAIDDQTLPQFLAFGDMECFLLYWIGNHSIDQIKVKIKDKMVSENKWSEKFDVQKELYDFLQTCKTNDEKCEKQDLCLFGHHDDTLTSAAQVKNRVQENDVTLAISLLGIVKNYESGNYSKTIRRVDWNSDKIIALLTRYVNGLLKINAHELEPFEEKMDVKNVQNNGWGQQPKKKSVQPDAIVHESKNSKLQLISIPSISFDCVNLMTRLFVQNSIRKIFSSDMNREYVLMNRSFLGSRHALESMWLHPWVDVNHVPQTWNQFVHQIYTEAHVLSLKIHNIRVKGIDPIVPPLSHFYDKIGMAMWPTTFQLQNMIALQENRCHIMWSLGGGKTTMALMAMAYLDQHACIMNPKTVFLTNKMDHVKRLYQQMFRVDVIMDRNIFIAEYKDVMESNLASLVQKTTFLVIDDAEWAITYPWIYRLRQLIPFDCRVLVLTNGYFGFEKKCLPYCQMLQLASNRNFVEHQHIALGTKEFQMSNLAQLYGHIHHQGLFSELPIATVEYYNDSFSFQDKFFKSPIGDTNGLDNVVEGKESFKMNFQKHKVLFSVSQACMLDSLMETLQLELLQMNNEEEGKICKMDEGGNYEPDFFEKYDLAVTTHALLCDVKLINIQKTFSRLVIWDGVKDDCDGFELVHSLHRFGQTASEVWILWANHSGVGQIPQQLKQGKMLRNCLLKGLSSTFENVLEPKTVPDHDAVVPHKNFDPKWLIACAAHVQHVVSNQSKTQDKQNVHQKDFVIGQKRIWEEVRDEWNGCDASELKKLFKTNPLLWNKYYLCDQLLHNNKIFNVKPTHGVAHFIQKTIESMLAQQLSIKNVQKKIVMADLGCGNPPQLRSALEMFVNNTSIVENFVIQLINVDIFPVKIESKPNCGIKIMETFVQSELSTVAFKTMPRNHFDYIVCCQSLMGPPEHMASIVKRIHLSLKTLGMFLLIDSSFKFVMENSFNKGIDFFVHQMGFLDMILHQGPVFYGNGSEYCLMAFTKCDISMVENIEPKIDFTIIEESKIDINSSQTMDIANSQDQLMESSILPKTLMYPIQNIL